MARYVEVKEGQSFQDGTGLIVRVGGIETFERIRFSVTGNRKDPGTGRGEMSYFAFVSRFTRIDSVEESRARMKRPDEALSRGLQICPPRVA